MVHSRNGPTSKEEVSYFLRLFRDNRKSFGAIYVDNASNDELLWLTASGGKGENQVCTMTKVEQ